MNRNHNFGVIKIVEDNKLVAAQFLSISFRHVFREVNFVADAITHLGHSLPNNNTWVNKVSIETIHVLVFDIVNYGCPKDSII